LGLIILRYCAPRIVPNSQRLLDNSTNKIQFTLFLNFESHYNLQVSARYASKTWVSLLRKARFQRVSLSACVIIPLRYASGIIRLALQITIGDNSTCKFQRATLPKLGFHYFAKLVFSESHYQRVSLSRSAMLRG
jgi:hypothetical protein